MHYVKALQALEIYTKVALKKKSTLGNFINKNEKYLFSRHKTLPVYGNWANGYLQS